MPDFLNLAESIVNGEFMKSAQDFIAVNTSPSPTLGIQNYDKLGGRVNTQAEIDTKLAKSSHDRTEVQGLVNCIFEKFSGLLRPVLIFHKLNGQTFGSHSPYPPASPTHSLASASFSSFSTNNLSNANTELLNSKSHLDFGNKLSSSTSSLLASATISPINTESKNVVGGIQFPSSMYECVQAVMRSYYSMPDEWTEALDVFIDDLLHFYIEQTMRNSFISVSHLYKEEDWQTNETPPTGAALRSMHEAQQNSDTPSVRTTVAIGTYGHVTRLPIRFHALMTDLIYKIKAIPRIDNAWMTQSIATYFLECLRGFADTLHSLVLQLESDSGSSNEITTNAVPQLNMCASALPFISDTTAMEHGRQLLTVLSNVHYSVDEVLPTLLDALLVILPEHTHSTVETAFITTVTSLFTTLDELILRTYIRSNSLALHALLRKGYLHSGLQWTTIPISQVAEVRPIILEILTSLVAIHAEICSARKKDEERIMQALCVHLANSLCSCLSEIGELSRGGAQLALLECEFVEQVLKHYSTLQSEQLFEELIFVLEDKFLCTSNTSADKSNGHNSSNATTVLFEARQQREELLKRMNDFTYILFACFRTPENGLSKSASRQSLSSQDEDESIR
jgi:hypothetical protein